MISSRLVYGLFILALITPQACCISLSGGQAISLDNPGSVEGLFNVDTSGQGISWVVSKGLIRDINMEIGAIDKSGKSAKTKLKIENGYMPSFLLMTLPTLYPGMQKYPFTLNEIDAIQYLSVGPSELVECSLESTNPKNGLSSNAFTKVHFGQINGYSSISKSTATSTEVTQSIVPNVVFEGAKIEIGASASGPNGKKANSDATVLVGKIEKFSNKASAGSSGLIQASLDNLWATGGYIGVTSSETGASGSFATFLDALATVDLDNKIIVPAEYKGKIKAIAGQEATQTVDSAKGLTVLIRDIREKNGNKQEVGSLSVDGSFVGQIKSCDNGKIIQDAVDRVEVNDIIGVLGGAQYPEDVRIYKDLTLLGLPNSQGQLPVAKSFTLTNNAKLGLEILPSLGITAPLIDVGAGSLVWDGYRLASEGGLINLAAATYNENLAGLKVVTKSVNIKGKGKDQTIIDGSGVAPVFTILDSTVRMDGLKIQNGLGSLGLLAGGINNLGGKLTLKDSEVSNNKGFDFGGGILTASTLTLENAIISNNEAENGGGIFQADGTATITDSVISNNKANNGGAIFKLLGSTGVTNSILSNNKANNGNGGAICQIAGSTTVSGSTLMHNEALGDGLLKGLGGGIFKASGTATVTGSTLSNNLAVNGAGIYHAAGATTLTDSIMDKNTASNNGGAIYQILGDVSILKESTGSTVSNSNAKNGGGVYVDLLGLGSTTTVAGSALTMNHATDGNGGAIFNAVGTNTITGSSIEQNTASLDGGAIYQGAGGTTITGSILNGNTAGNNGGAIYQLAGTSSIAGSTLSANIAANNGGAINKVLGTATVTGSTLSNNLAVNGAGIYHAAGATTLTDSIMDKNTASNNGGAIYQILGDVSILKESTGSTVSNNNAKNGGGVYVDLLGLGSTTTVAGSALTMNHATDGNGGAIFNAVGTNTITGSSIEQNTASLNGGAIYQGAGGTTITGSILNGNTAGNNGGAIYQLAGTSSIAGSTLSANIAANNGGAIYQVLGGTTIKDSMLNGNSATTGYGGGIYSTDGVLAPLYLKGTTSVIGNNAALGGSSLYQWLRGGGVYKGAYLGSGANKEGGVTVSGNTPSP